MKMRAAMALLVLATVPLGCFKKGSGEGKRETRPDFDGKGDVFLPGGGNKPGGEKPGEEEEEMDPEAAALLAACFGIPVTEVQPVVGWDDASAARTAAQGLCDDLDAVKYNKGTIINDADAVVIE